MSRSRHVAVDFFNSVDVSPNCRDDDDDYDTQEERLSHPKYRTKLMNDGR